jgi:hypothetical protein
MRTGEQLGGGSFQSFAQRVGRLADLGEKRPGESNPVGSALEMLMSEGVLKRMGRKPSTRSPIGSASFNLSARSRAGGCVNSRSKTSARERYPSGSGGPNDILRCG